MIRTFETHKVRVQKELTGRLWDFSPCMGENAGKKYKVATPCCWENHPDFTVIGHAADLDQGNFLVARGSNELIALNAQGWDAFLNGKKS